MLSEQLSKELTGRRIETLRKLFISVNCRVHTLISATRGLRQEVSTQRDPPQKGAPYLKDGMFLLTGFFSFFF